MFKVFFVGVLGKIVSDEYDTISVIEAISRCRDLHGVYPCKVMKYVEMQPLTFDKGGYIDIVECGSASAVVYYNTVKGCWEVYYRQESKPFEDYEDALSYAKNIAVKEGSKWELIDEIKGEET